MVNRTPPPQRLRSLTIVLLVLASLTYLLYSCMGFGPVPQSDYVGRWQLDGPNGQTTTLTLSEGGSVKVDNTPRGLFALGGYSELDWNDTIALTGSWSEYDGSKIWVRTSLGSTVMWATGRGWGMRLGIVAGGDPDNSPTFTFERAQ